MAVISNFKQKKIPKSHTALFFTAWSLILILALLCLGYGICVYSRLIKHRAKIESDFKDYMKTYGRNYSKEEYEKRIKYFAESIEEIRLMNEAHAGALNPAKFGYTKFSDMSKDEFRKLHRGSALLEFNKNDYNLTCKVKPIAGEKKSSENLPKTEKATKIPLKKDWRDEGVVSAVVDQGGCGSCWAHSVVGVMESMVQIRKLTETELYSNLSIQELIDCSTYTRGCRGGNPKNALDFLCQITWPIVPVGNYPALDTGNNPKHDCRINKPDHGVVAKEIFIRYYMKPQDIAYIVAKHGPVTAIVNANSWTHYLGGVIQYHCSSSENVLTHVVQIVGYKIDTEVPYFILRNSYGEDWGDHGYVYTAMTGICGVGVQITFLDVAVV